MPRADQDGGNANAAAAGAAPFLSAPVTPPSVSRSYSSLLSAAAEGGEMLLDEEWDLEENAESIVEALLHTVDSVLYTGKLDEFAPVVGSNSSPAFGSTPAGPVRFPHRKTVVSYLDECREWSAAFTHMRVQGSSIADTNRVMTDSIKGKRTSRHSHNTPASTNNTNSSSLESTAAASHHSHSLAAASSPIESVALSLTIVPVARCRESPDEVVEEVLASDGVLEEVFACDSSGPLAPYSSLVHIAGTTDARLAAQRAAEETKKSCPPWTPERLCQHEMEQEKLDHWWHDFLHPHILSPLVPHIVALVTRAYERDATPEDASEGAVAAAAAEPPQEEEEEEVLFFDGDTSMPNPFATPPASPPSHSPSLPASLVRLYESMRLDARGRLGPARRLKKASGDVVASNNAADADSSSNFVRIAIRRPTTSQHAAMDEDDLSSESSGGEEEEGASPSRRARGGPADLDAAADFASAAGGSETSVLLPADLDLDEDSMCDPLSYHSPSHHSRYSLTHSASRSRRTDRRVGGDSVNPLSRSASRQKNQFAATAAPSVAPMAVSPAAAATGLRTTSAAALAALALGEDLLIKDGDFVSPPSRLASASRTSRPVSRVAAALKGGEETLRPLSARGTSDLVSFKHHLRNLSTDSHSGAAPITVMPAIRRHEGDTAASAGVASLAAPPSPRFQIGGVRASPTNRTTTGGGGGKHDRTHSSVTPSHSLASSSAAAVAAATAAGMSANSRRQYLSSADIRRKARHAILDPTTTSTEANNNTSFASSSTSLQSIMSPNLAHRRFKPDGGGGEPLPLDTRTTTKKKHVTVMAATTSSPSHAHTAAHSATTTFKPISRATSASAAQRKSSILQAPSGPTARLHSNRASLRDDSGTLARALSLSSGSNSNAGVSSLSSTPLHILSSGGGGGGGSITPVPLGDLDARLRRMSMGAPSGGGGGGGTLVASPKFSFLPASSTTPVGGGARTRVGSSTRHRSDVAIPELTLMQQRPHSSSAALRSAQRARTPHQAFGGGGSLHAHTFVAPTHVSVSSLRQFVPSPMAASGGGGGQTRVGLRSAATSKSSTKAATPTSAAASATASTTAPGQAPRSLPAMTTQTSAPPLNTLFTPSHLAPHASGTLSHASAPPLSPSVAKAPRKMASTVRPRGGATTSGQAFASGGVANKTKPSTTSVRVTLRTSTSHAPPTPSPSSPMRALSPTTIADADDPPDVGVAFVPFAAALPPPAIGPLAAH